MIPPFAKVPLTYGPLKQNLLIITSKEMPIRMNVRRLKTHHDLPAEGPEESVIIPQIISSKLTMYRKRTIKLLRKTSREMRLDKV